MMDDLQCKKMDVWPAGIAASVFLSLRSRVEPAVAAVHSRLQIPRTLNKFKQKMIIN